MTRLLPDHRATRLLLAVMFGLLALGPFLHAHLGFSKVTGFHVAGYNAPVATHDLADTQRLAASPDLFDAESPAVGVSASLIRFDFDIPCPDGMTLQSIIAIVATCVVSLLLLRPVRATSACSARPRPGLPPPALAPPAFFCSLVRA